MLNEKMLDLGKRRSEIRELFEYGKILKANGEKVYDLTLGNPTSKTPDWVTETLKEGLLKDGVHSYTQAQGSIKARKVIASGLNKMGATQFNENGIVLTCGAAASLCGAIKSLVSSQNTEIIALSPYFPEYKVFVEGAGAKFISVGFKGNNFSPNLDELEKAITPNTHAVIINNPNNPSGKVYTAKEIEDIAVILEKKQTAFSHPIYIISDEPYREIVFENETLPFIPDFYKNTIICYSYSKSLSLPGERIGYIAIPTQIDLINDLYAGFLGSLRSYGYVCAPSLFQYMIENFEEEYADFSVYERNKNVLLKALKEFGFTCNTPKGAFYLMIQAPDGDGKKMSEIAKGIGLLVVPADTFGAKGWTRIATCVSPDTVEGAIPLFKQLAKSYGL